jgi:spermidine synthase
MIIQNLMQNYNRYLVSLASISLISLSMNIIMFSEYPLAQIFFILTYIILAIVCFRSDSTDWSYVLIRMQIYALIPSLVAFTLCGSYGITSYILHLLLFIVTNLICIAEFKKRSKLLVFNQEFYSYALGGLFILTSLTFIGMWVKIEICLFLMNSLFLYILTSGLVIEPKKASDLESNNQTLILVCMIIVVLMMMFQPFLSEYHIVRIIYLVSYVILLTTICFALRGKKMLFFGFCVVMIISHFLPNKIHTFFDLTIISMLAMLFYMQNYVLQEVESAFSKLKVIYDYKANKVLLCADNIVQSEQYYYGNSNHIPNFNYYGNTLNTGPVYDIFSKCDSKNLHKNVAVIGLGAGTIAAYGKEGQNFTFYEIDPEVRLIANNQEYFTFLKTSKANVSFVMGDARKTLEKAKDQEYGIIFIDVYKGNAIPESFLTIEAVNLYLRKLQQGGLIVIHITTDNSGVESILGKLAIDLKLDAYVTCVDEYSSDNDQQTDVSGLIVRKGGNNKWYSSLLKNLLSFSGIKTVSSSGAVSKWVIISRNKKDLLDLISDHSWHILAVDADQEIVTDESIGYGDTARGIITKKIN